MKLDLTGIYEDTEIKNFFRSRTLRDSSKETYAHALKTYCNFCDKTPTDLIEEAEDEEENRVRMKRRKIRDYFLNFHEYLRNEGKSQNTIANHFTAIKAFYKSSEIELPTISISSKSEANLAQNEVVLTKEEINKAITLCNLKYRALILLMCSSGMGSAEVRSLQYGHFLDSINEYLEYDIFDIEDISRRLEKKDDLIGVWKIRRIKTGKEYTTFSSPESIKAIIEYLLDSKKQNKSIENRDNYLFGEGNEPLSMDAFEKYFFRLNERCGFGKIGRQGYLKSHALRHYFGTKLHEKGIADYDYRKMMGKSLPKDMAPTSNQVSNI